MAETKHCIVCGRTITWRRKWADCWDEVKYCSAACRERTLGDVDQALEAAILSLLHEREFGKTICPSEAARVVDADRWRELMEPTRMAARRLVNAGMIVFRQRGQPVDPSRAKGPFRLRLANNGRVRSALQRDKPRGGDSE